jgi:DHA2 family multidrug resistance protein
MGMAFLFVPINTISYAGMPPQASNQVSAMINLMRNVGGSIGISLVTTLIVRRAQIHQSYLAANTYAANPRLQQMLHGITQQLATRSGPAEASRQAVGVVAGQLARQSTMLAYIDTFRLMAIVCILAMGLLFFAKKIKPGKAAMGH